jgi:hypothetical protein
VFVKFKDFVYLKTLQALKETCRIGIDLLF